MDSFKQFFKSLGDFIGRMTPSQVMMLFGVTAGTIVGIVFLVGWVSSVTYSRLYANLEQQEAGEVVTWLNDNNIPYKVSADGRSIEVPSDQVHETRMALAAEGMPRSGSVGYSLFDQNNLGMTDFLQNLNFRRALEGELTRTIMQLREVKAARVHIVIPKERLFREDKQEATASVVLKLSSRGLTKHQIDGITNLVAASVEGLRPNNIAIVDYEGNLLTSGQDRSAVAGLSSTQLEVRKNVEHYLEDKAQSMLDGVLGPNTAIVRVTADLNFQQLERTSETYDPNSPSIRSEERSKTSQSIADKATEEAESTEEGTEETTITNYELNKTVEHIINAVGGVERLSLAVMVDGTYNEVEGEDGVESIYEPRPQEELDRLAAIVKNAVGFDPQRNDQIEVVNIPFDRRDLETDQQALDSMYQREFYLDLAKKIGLVLLVLIGLLYLKKKSNKLFGALKTLVPPRPVAPPVQETQRAKEVEQEEEETVEVQPEKRKPRLVDQMQKVASDRPDELAKVIKTMMLD
ncbi:flagellar M-ring protein FliF [candidate division GN15 bacterium]|nr:flagellar M-ring protein FliF [candidate division GN15 bacterium]